MDFEGKLGKYKIIETLDQTKTLWSEYFNEAFHNLFGAYEETLYNYISGCHIENQFQSSQSVHVLDVGCGLGIGLKAFIDQFQKYKSPGRNHSYTSMELDEDLFLWSVQETFPNYTFLKIDHTYICQVDELVITIYIGDGRKTLPEAFHKGFLPQFTAIFQDAFSPKQNPALWTVEWFNDLLMMSSPEVYLSTYSSSVSVRKSMIAAGWKVMNIKGFGQKRTMTKARIMGESDQSVVLELSRSPALELRDI